MPDKQEVTRLLHLAQHGNRAAESRLIELLYADLRRVARSCMRSEDRRHTLQPTALVHEAFRRMRNREKPWVNRTHYLSAALHTMRQVLVDYARSRKAAKRGGEMQEVTLDSNVAASAGSWTTEFLDVHRALERLAKFDARMSQVVELRFFGGLTDVEIAQVLGISDRTVKREWDVARAWLEGELEIYRDERSSANGHATT